MLSFNKIKEKIVYQYKIRIKKDKFLLAVRKWFRDGGDKTLRLNYPTLKSSSIVLDVGGFKGEWADNIYKKYSPSIFVFEPVKQYYEIIQEKFSENEKVSSYPFGLSNANKNMDIALQEDGSSTIKIDSDNIEKAELIDVFEFFENEGFEDVGLMKINIEGGEFDLLNRMIEKGLIEKCENLQIQFHDFFPEAQELREKIREKLSKTHKLTYDYYFVWENWERL